MKKNGKILKKRILAAVVLVMVFLFPMVSTAAERTVPGTVCLREISAPAYNKIQISWHKVSDATHYKIYYRKAGAARWNFVAAVGASKDQYLHHSTRKAPVVVGQDYNYTVKAYNKKTGLTGEFDQKGLTVRSIPSKVKLISAKYNKKESGVTLKWNPTRSCDHYVIYRKAGSDTKWKKIGSVKAGVKSFTDKEPIFGEKNCYTVRAGYSRTGVYGNYNKRGITVSLPKRYIPVTDVDIQPEYDRITLKEGESVTLKGVVEPSNASDKSVTWALKGGNGSVKMDINGNAVTITAVSGHSLEPIELIVRSKDNKTEFENMFITVKAR